MLHLWIGHQLLWQTRHLASERYSEDRGLPSAAPSAVGERWDVLQRKWRTHTVVIEMRGVDAMAKVSTQPLALAICL